MKKKEVMIIKPRKRISWADFIEIWEYRELLYFLAWRDLKVRYKQTAIGVLWALFRPFIQMIIFSIIFGYFVKVPTNEIPYPIFVYVGLLLWQLFSSSLGQASSSLVSNQSLLTKVYFPRLLIPIASTITHLVDFFVGSFILVGLMAYYHYTPSLLGILLMPVLIIITLIIAIGGGMILTSINVKYRDVAFVLPFFIQILMYVTPVIYPSSILGKYSWIIAINPMTGVIKAARSTILAEAPMNWFLLAISVGTSIVILILGTIFFKKTERYFADIV